MEFNQLKSEPKLKHSQHMNTHPRFACIILPLICGVALLVPAAPARAAIAIVDTSTVTHTAPVSTSVSSGSFTVSAGANLMVVTYCGKESANSGGTNQPAFLTWDGLTLTNLADSNDSANSWRDIAIYYIYNPPVGVASAITGTAKASMSDQWLAERTFSGVDTTAVPLSGSVSNSGTIFSSTVPGVTANSVGVMDTLVTFASGQTLTVTTPNGGTVTPVTDTTDGSSVVTMGYVTGLVSGNNQFVATASVSGQRGGLIEGIFAPPVSGPPIILVQPAPVTVYPSQTAQFIVSASGAATLTNLWTTNGVALADGPRADGSIISGSGTTTLTISNVTAAEAGNYVLTVTNGLGGTNSTAGVLTVLATGPETNFTLNFPGTNVVEGSGADWNTTNSWNPLGLSATILTVAYPGSTFEIFTGSRLRSPATAATFPGVQLTLDGSGVFENGGTGNPTNVSELRFKNNDVTNYLSSLVLNGGEIDAGNSGTLIIQGGMTVAANSTIYVDNSTVTDRGVRIDSLLSGTGNLLWHEASGTLGGVDLQITGTANTFKGQWIVDQGALIGVGANSLGTNNIIVGTNGLNAAIETMYDINNPNATLVLGANGQMFLHQNDSFGSVIVNGTSLANGTYPYSTLNSRFPNNFPPIWSKQAGSTFTAYSGQIVVTGITVTLPPSSPHITSIQVGGTGGLTLSATNGTPGGSWALLQSTNVALPLSQWQTNRTGTFDGSGNLSTNIVNTATNTRDFYILKVQ
jgi:hypothetical protein